MTRMSPAHTQTCSVRNICDTDNKSLLSRICYSLAQYRSSWTCTIWAKLSKLQCTQNLTTRTRQKSLNKCVKALQHFFYNITTPQLEYLILLMFSVHFSCLVSFKLHLLQEFILQMINIGSVICHSVYDLIQHLAHGEVSQEKEGRNEESHKHGTCSLYTSFTLVPFLLHFKSNGT